MACLIDTDAPSPPPRAGRPAIYRVYDRGAAAGCQGGSGCPGDAEAGEVVAPLGRVAVAVGGPAVGADAVPRAAALHAQRAARRPLGVDGGAAAVVVPVVPVVDPLPDVAVHVVEAEGVGRVEADRRGAGDVGALGGA